MTPLPGFPPARPLDDSTPFPHNACGLNLPPTGAPDPVGRDLPASVVATAGRLTFTGIRMLSFAVYVQGKLADKVNLGGAYVVGTDDVPLRAELSFKNGIITCKKRAAGPAGLAILWKVEGAGTILLETIRVQERERPYVLQVELARGRLLRINHKLEDWGLLDSTEAERMNAGLNEARDTLIAALKTEEPAEAAMLGEKALALAVQASEEFSRVQARSIVTRRAQVGATGKRTIGCGAHLDPPSDAIKKRLAGTADFVTLPITWRDIEPNEQVFNWKPLDAWVEMLVKSHIPIRASALLSFHERNVPDWLYIWETDFDAIRDLAFEHVRRIINRYGQYVQSWVVASGLHASNCFSFSFEQLVELTRVASTLTKQLSPRSASILEIASPWGEYYSRNQRTIPPLLYADMAVQSGIGFDAFGLRTEFGPGRDGHYVRDMFQVSAMLDQFAKLNKPLHITAAQVPSAPIPLKADAADAGDGGSWHGGWSEATQAEWLRRFIEVAFSKPFIESVAWQTFADRADQEIPFGGLLRNDLAPKEAYRELQAVRKELLPPQRAGA